MQTIMDLKEKSGKIYLPRLLYVGDVPVEATYYGSLYLYRLLKGYPSENLLIIETKRRTSDPQLRLPKIRYETVPGSWQWGGRFLQTHFTLFFWPTWKLLSTHWANACMKHLQGFHVEAILTVHEGSIWMSAVCLARRLGIPYHLVLNDDWLRRSKMTKWLRRHVEKQFGLIYRQASSRFCASPYMEETYRQRYRARGDVLYPFREDDALEYAAPPDLILRKSGPFTVAYGGSTFDGGYLEALKHLAEILFAHGGRLVLFGPFSREEAIRNGLGMSNVEYRGLVTSAEMIECFRNEADILFVPMSFDDAISDNMKAGFPSKLADYTAAGLPLLIYGPSYCSAVCWGKENAGIGEVVDRLDRHLLESAVVKLMNAAQYRYDLGLNALQIGKKYFSHSSAETLFFSRLNEKYFQDIED